MSTEELSKIHEENKRHLSRLNLDRRNYSNVIILDRYGENILIKFIKTIETMRTVKTEEFKYIRVKDTSTGKHTFLSVPNSMRRCKEAIAWTFSLSPKQYELFFET